MSAAAPHAYDFHLAKDLIEWMARLFRSHL